MVNNCVDEFNVNQQHFDEPYEADKLIVIKDDLEKELEHHIIESPDKHYLLRSLDKILCHIIENKNVLFDLSNERTEDGVLIRTHKFKSIPKSISYGYDVDMDAAAKKIYVHLGKWKHGFNDLFEGGIKHQTFTIGLNCENQDHPEPKLLVRGVNKSKNLEESKIKRNYSLVSKSLTFFKEIRNFPKLAVPHTLLHYETKKGHLKTALMNDFYEGGCLTSKLNKINLSNRFKIVDNILEGLQGLHENGFIHFDIKPDNILLKKNSDGDFEGYITDFDLVQKKGEITHYGGTPGFKAPELTSHLTDKAKIDQSIDIFSMGISCLLIFNNKIDVNSEFCDSQEYFVTELSSGEQLKFLSNLPFEKEMPTECWTAICKVLIRMIDPIPENRISAKEAREEFKNINEKLFKGALHSG